MIEGFEFQHYKGGTYECLGVAIPYNKAALIEFGMGAPYQVYDALTPDNMDLIEMNVWEKAGVMICDSEIPQIIYRAYVDWDDERGREYGDTWARAINNFYDRIPILKDDNTIGFKNRFSMCFDEKLIHPKKKELVGV